MADYSLKAISGLLLLVMLATCQKAAPAAPLQPTRPASSPLSQPTQALPASLTQVPETPLPGMLPTGNLSPILSATSTPHGTPHGISQDMDALIPPIPPAQLAATRQAEGVLLSWMGTGSDIDTHYVIYRRLPGEDAWQTLGFVATEGDNRDAYSYLDASAEAGQSQEYSVSTFDQYGKESDRTIIQVEPSP